MEILSVLTWLEIIDSAVKIGLGALIGAFATYFAVRQTQKGAARARRDQTKSELLQQVAGEVETVTDDVLTFLATWNLEIDKAEGVLSNDCLIELGEIGSAINKKGKNLTSAGAKLMLLGYEEADTALTAYRNIIGKILGGPIQPDSISKFDLGKTKKDFHEHRDAFFASLFKVFTSDP